MDKQEVTEAWTGEKSYGNPTAMPFPPPYVMPALIAAAESCFLVRSHTLCTVGYA